MTHSARPSRAGLLHSPWWVWAPLIGSVITLVPALPVSFALSALALIAVLLTDRSAAHRRLALRLVVIWIILQIVVTSAGVLLWNSFQG
ncbi:MAG: hypothetical protein Q4D96_01895 [Propionibacteriaceae bacterium]|nr:hypothetical protein [Propionibacteriaceae bacterium]